eukprot:3292231-Amphidinium_carterae.1
MMCLGTIAYGVFILETMRTLVGTKGCATSNPHHCQPLSKLFKLSSLFFGQNGVSSFLSVQPVHSGSRWHACICSTEYSRPEHSAADLIVDVVLQTGNVAQIAVGCRTDCSFRRQQQQQQQQQ